MSPGPCRRCGFDATQLTPRLWDEPSPYEHLLRSSPPPAQAPHERQEVKDFIGGLRLGLHETNSTIERLRAALAGAKADRDTITNKIDAYIALNPPIYDVPTELLVRIFSFVVGRQFSIFYRGNTRAPWVLGRVCSRWRTVAWGTPRLWSNFQIREDIRHCYWYRKAKGRQRVKAVLDRSEPTALSTRMVEITPRTLAPFVGHASRLQDLFIFCERQNLRHLRILGELSGLQKLRLNYSDGDNDTPRGEDYDGFTTALHLVEVEFNIGRFPPVPVRWDQLTRLKVQARVGDAATISPWKEIYQKCSNLATLEHCFSIMAQFHQHPSNNEVYDTSVTLPPVQHLFVSSPYQLKLFSCPSLQSLDVYMDVLRADVFQDFLQRSQCSLHRLKIRDLHVSKDSSVLQDFLSSFDTVTELEIQESTSFSLNMLLSKLEYDKARLCFPRLQSLTIRTHKQRHIRGEVALISILESRRDAQDIEPLRTVRLEYHWEHYVNGAMVKAPGLGDVSNSWISKLHAGLREFVDEGLKVEIERVSRG